MKLGSSISISAGALLAIGVAGWLLATYARREGIAIGKQLEHDAGVDRSNAAAAAAVRKAAADWQHQRDSIEHAAQLLRARAAAASSRADSAEQRLRAMPGAMVPKDSALAVIAEKNATIAAKDAVIAQDTVGIRARDQRILELTSSLRVYTDSIVPGLTRDRDWWKKRASSPCGLGGAVGLGIRGADAVAGVTCRIALPHLF